MTVFDYFARKCFGARGERLVRTLVLCAVVYGGLAATEWRVAISPFVFGLMLGAFSGGVMGRTLIAADGQRELRHMLMLPSSARSLVGGYVIALAAYTLATKTLPLLAILLGVCDWTAEMLLSGLLCALNGVLLAALFAASGRRRWAALLWAFVLLVLLRIGTGQAALPVLLALSAIACIYLLGRADAYALLCSMASVRSAKKRAQHGLMLRYFLRYLLAHKNYLVNTVGLWAIAAALPFFFASFAGHLFVAPLGFAILTLNTPLGILLSVDPALERAVRTLPGGARRFCLPYVALLAGANLLADGIFLASWQLTIGTFRPAMVAAALCIAMQSAIAVVWLEWRHPLRNWRVESDLWHHPRKYIVPVAMLFLAAAIGSWPKLLVILLALLAAECGLLAWRLMRA